jgi:GGDEF domain-containing protein
LIGSSREIQASRSPLWEELLNRIGKALRNILLENGGGELPHVTISFGIASAEYETATSIQELIERADLRMLEAKSSGHDRIVTEGGIVESAITG